jgi:cytosine/adenosine deaminase-related metal-dependent hydrolase
VSTVVLEGCAIATMDDAGTEHASGHIVVAGNRITAVGPGVAPQTGAVDRSEFRHIDADGCLATPGLINTHHHLYQWATRGIAADATLFEWLTELYPVWAAMDAEVVATVATAGLGWLAKTGCTATADHHYVFPRSGGDVLGATVAAARKVGLRFHPTRGSMDLGASSGGLPPDDVVESLDEILAATEAAIAKFHNPSPESMLRVGVAPCSPFSVSGELLGEAARLARSLGVRLHTHLAETSDETRYCLERFGRTPVEYLDSLGWLGTDVWLAHVVHLDDAAITRLAATGTGAAHCPSSNARLGSGICRTPALLQAGVPVGLGVDGSASNEASSLLDDVRQAVRMARAVGGPHALSVRQALRMATRGGAQVLGRADDIGALEPGKLADIALWRMDTLPHAGIADPVAALVLGARPPLELLLVNGQPVVEHDRLVTVDEEEIAAAARRASARAWPTARPVSAR